MKRYCTGLPNTGRTVLINPLILSESIKPFVSFYYLAKEVVFLPVSVVCLLAGWFVSRVTKKNYLTDFHETSIDDGFHPRIDY